MASRIISGRTEKNYQKKTPTVQNSPVAAAAAKVFLLPDVEPVIQKCKEELHFAFDLPYGIDLPSSSFDNITTQVVESWGCYDMLGFVLEMDDKVGLPKLKSIHKSTSAV